MKKVYHVFYFVIVVSLLTSCSSKSWRDASRESAGIAPKASELKEDIFQVYYARAFSWRGTFAVHPWIAWKKVGESSYTVAEVSSWNLRRSNSSISIEQTLPDRFWFDHEPTLLFEVRGPKAKVVIEKAQKLINKYPYQNQYTLWPGPNSNTFVSYILRNIEEIRIELPPHAIGKDYLEPGQFLTTTPSNSGFQLSLFGVMGLSAGLGEGVEFNILSLNFGVDFFTPAIKLPFLGRLGFEDKPL